MLVFKDELSLLYLNLIVHWNWPTSFFLFKNAIILAYPSWGSYLSLLRLRVSDPMPTGIAWFYINILLQCYPSYQLDMPLVQIWWFVVLSIYQMRIDFLYTLVDVLIEPDLFLIWWEEYDYLYTIVELRWSSAVVVGLPHCLFIFLISFLLLIK